jgi:hypothetical protein
LRMADCRLIVGSDALQSAIGNLKSAIELRGTRPKHRAEPHKLRQVGATPTPATNFGQVGRRERGQGRKRAEVVIISPARFPTFSLVPTREAFRLPVCKTGVAKQNRKRRLERYQRLPPTECR